MSLIAQLYAARWLLLSIAIVIFAANKYRQYRLLQAFNGPFSTGWSDLWHIRAILSMRSHLIYKDVNDKYGKR